MENVIGFGEVAGAIFLSFAVALTLEWIGLVGLMRMMPARKAKEIEPRKAELAIVARERKNAA